MRDADNQIDRNDFAGGYALYCFEIEPNFGITERYLTLVKQGKVRLRHSLQKPCEKLQRVLFMLSFRDILKSMHQGISF